MCAKPLDQVLGILITSLLEKQTIPLWATFRSKLICVHRKQNLKELQELPWTTAACYFSWLQASSSASACLLPTLTNKWCREKIETKENHIPGFVLGTVAPVCPSTLSTSCTTVFPCTLWTGTTDLLWHIAGCMMMMILVRCVDPRIDLFGI